MNFEEFVRLYNKVIVHSSFSLSEDDDEANYNCQFINAIILKGKVTSTAIDAICEEFPDATIKGCLCAASMYKGMATLEGIARNNYVSLVDFLNTVNVFLDFITSLEIDLHTLTNKTMDYGEREAKANKIVRVLKVLLENEHEFMFKFNLDEMLPGEGRDDVYIAYSIYTYHENPRHFLNPFLSDKILQHIPDKELYFVSKDTISPNIDVGLCVNSFHYNISQVVGQLFPSYFSDAEQKDIILFYTELMFRLENYCSCKFLSEHLDKCLAKPALEDGTKFYEPPYTAAMGFNRNMKSGNVSSYIPGSLGLMIPI